MSNKQQEWTISYKQIGVILMSFVLGLVVALLVSNSQPATSTSFTTTELIGFVMSVILSGASIVLAIAAIALGRSSEQAVISRSDESIRLQTEVFTKTTDALQSIKSSTDVTEKRIEDIISGRAGDLSKQIAEIATDETGVGGIDVKNLEEKIRKSIAQSFDKREISENEKEQIELRRKEARLRRQEYEKHHEELLLSIANKPDVEIKKIGHGTPSKNEDPIARYDAVFKKDNINIAVSTFSPSKNERFVLRSYGDIIQALATPLEDEKIQKLYLILFEEDQTGEAVKTLEEAKSLMKEAISSKINIVAIPYSNIEEWANELRI